MSLETKSSREMFTVQLPGFKNKVGRFTCLFIPKRELPARVRMLE